MGLLAIPRGGPEVSDVIVSFDPATLERAPVKKSDVIREFAALGNWQAVRVVERIPASGGMLDAEAVDRLLVTAHCEMQRISEEFQHGRRVAELLRPVLGALREGGASAPLRVVDVGCGTGFVVRWLAANERFGDDVEITGVDFNPALVREAQRLAAAENLACDFAVANAFRMDRAAAVYISTGILHHFRGRALADLFAQHDREATCAFVHFDFHPSPLAPFGSWLFHAVRMREPLAKHDGVLSAVRAHPSRRLLDAARTAAPGFASAIYGTRLWGLPVPRVFHALVGLRPQFRDSFLRHMGRRVASLGKIE